VVSRLRLEIVMVVAGSSFFAVPDRHPVPGRFDAELVVWLRGQHDDSTEKALCLTLAHAIALGRRGLVLDLTEVRDMSPSTLAVIVRAREYLRQRSASLTVRAPSARVRHLIDTCGVNDLLGPEGEAAAGDARKALGRWSPTSSAERYDRHPSQAAPVPRRAHRPSVKARV
jgi:anti-anti-sigma factor